MFKWQGRIDSEDGSRGLRWHQVIDHDDHLKHPKSVALVGLACDLGVQANKGRVGAVDGPNSIRAALANLPWHWDAALADLGDSHAKHDLASVQNDYAAKVTEGLAHHSLVIGLGGGHEIGWGSYLGLEAALANKQQRIGIINFDAHFDLRRPAPDTSSGTPFRQVAEHRQQHGLPFDYACLGVSKAANTPALFDFAAASGTRFLFDHQCQMDAAVTLLAPMLRDIDELYVTICLDAFPAAIAPGVSAPSALGISPQFVITMLDWLAAQQSRLNYRWRLCDIAEMNPRYDSDNRTAKLAARLAFETVDALIGK
ncbi:formimidoylglutamase [Aestuariibacter halophilus]|uniref:Formimidoylglutamase n=1 Tax=Fluctibacter halophilus TaxID=226011 RepID=A0ABS8GA68_9ALTE|nr:formimidoylglutamase [Aestuariibacter halophilus]MCC2617485.1 formimidoylglutamase [Aestuariibacter halophilus]